MNVRQSITIVVATLMVLSVGTPLVAADHSDLEFEVTQDDDFDATITVTHNGTAVAGANVTVAPVPPGRTYNGSGEYVTDANGTVELPAPRDDLLVEILVSHNNSSTTDELVLKADETDEDETELAVEIAQHDDFTATVTVTDNGDPAAGANVSVAAPAGNYTGTGQYVTDSNGTVDLPAPDEEVRIVVTASLDNETAATSERLEAPENETDEDETDENETDGNETDNVGQELQAFLELIDDPDEPRGLLIADFVLANNPGNPPEHAGPPEDHPLASDDGNETDLNESNTTSTEGNSTDADSEDEDDRRGPPEDDERGPPDDGDEHEDDESTEEEDRRGPPDDDERGPPEDGEDDESDDSTEDDRRGPSEDDERGPPDDGDEEENDEASGDEEDQRGPPDDDERGPPEDDEDDEDDDNGNGHGPPGDRGR